MYINRHRIGLIVLLTLVIGAHLALWGSTAPYDAKLRLTILNATVWAVILLPAVGVNLWLRAHQCRNQSPATMALRKVAAESPLSKDLP